MIRTTITPIDTNITLSVPESYVGKKVEVLMFDTDEVKNKVEPIMKPSALRGGLSKETAEKMQQYIQQSRDEWNT
ncbi:hypothetical protein FC093_13555 [Ilyomonas limi]|uniref:Uncharacterized protein n=1 Tax=Ilyomonas limi TaxID=2575867 RepID=A0A4U3KYG5_9BACT|nr:hypothetical protein [Ilyomonas limi]TKK67771.1 hypothetical protein FC093_13555 [Ilyomonas limi]